MTPMQPHATIAFDHVGLGAPDPAGAARDWSLVLGLAPVERPDGGFRFQFDRGALEIAAGSPGPSGLGFLHADARPGPAELHGVALAWVPVVGAPDARPVVSTPAGDAVRDVETGAGQVHAIDAGNLILEIQQNSDTTYRVYDWGRVGLDGRPRQMHLAQSLRSIDWNDFEPAPLRAAPTSGVIADCAEFRIRRVVLDPGQRLHLRAGEEPRLVSVVRGSLDATAESGGPRPRFRLARGDTVLAPFAGAFTFAAESAAIALVTEGFGG